MNRSKGKSPFYPGQPVPVELFVGRQAQVEHIVRRGVEQVTAGKPVAVFVRGEYGIGKSSIAGYVQAIAERDHKLHGIYATLGAAQEIGDVGGAVLEATLRSGALDSRRTEAIRHWLAKYIGQQSLFGVTLRVDALRADAPSIAQGILPFLREVLERLKDQGVRGIFLVLDEVNGITANRHFAHLIKNLVDSNALSPRPLPLLLMVCGVDERLREMIASHASIARIFDVVDIEVMSREEMSEFFVRSFASVQVKVEPGALNTLTHYSGGFPKIMHLVGDSAFWIDGDGNIDDVDAAAAVIAAADEVGKRYFDPQVYQALKSADYKSILSKIASMGPDFGFRKSEIPNLTDSEKRRLHNFLRRMKKLKVLRSGELPGEYVFTSRMVALYVALKGQR